MFPLSLRVLFLNFSLLLGRLTFTDAAYWSLSLSPCDVVMCLWAKGEGEPLAQWCWLHFSTSDKMIEHHHIKLKTQKTKIIWSLSTVMDTVYTDRPV